MCFHLWFQISVFNGSQNLCNDFIIVSIKHDKTNPRVKKNTTLGWVLMLFPRRHRPFQKNKDREKTCRHGNRAAPRLCFGSCGMECMGLGDGGWDTLCSTRLILQSSCLRITLRFSNNQQRSLPGKHASSNAEHCILTVTPPPPKNKT